MPRSNASAPRAAASRPRWGRFLAATALLLAAGGLLFPQAAARADDIEQEGADRALSEVLQKSPGEDLREVWMLSEKIVEIGRPAIQPLRRRLEGEMDDGQRLAVSRALIHLGDDLRGIEELQKIAAGNAVKVPIRMGALDLISFEGELDEAEWLEEQISVTHEPYVKLAMAKAIWNINKANKGVGREVMLQYMNSSDADLRAEGALALGEIGDPVARPVLMRLKDEPTAQGRMAALLIQIFHLRTLQEQRLREPVETDTPPIEPPPTVSPDGEWPLLDEIRAIVEKYYVHKDEVDFTEVEDGAAAGFTQALDPFSNYMTPAENAMMLERPRPQLRRCRRLRLQRRAQRQSLHHQPPRSTAVRSTRQAFVRVTSSCTSRTPRPRA